MEMLTLETTCEEIMALYQEVYQLKRNPGEVPCLEDMTEEIQIEILEMLKECLWHRWGPVQLEEPRWRTPRMPAEAEYYTQMHVTYKHFGHFQDQQQESQEEALRVVREAHHWALAHSSDSGRTHRVAELLHLSWAALEPWVFWQLLALRKQMVLKKQRVFQKQKA